MLSLEQIQPTQDRVLIKPDAVPDVTPGGIIIPDVVNKDNPNYYTMTGVVLAAGPGAREEGERQPMPVAVGDRVVFGRYAGKQIEVDGHGIVLMMRATEVIGHTDAAHVQPGYQAAKHGAVKGTPAPASKDYQIA